MIKYLVHKTSDKTSATVALDVAAKISHLSEDEILWALDEQGLCETDTHVICEIYVEQP